MKTIEQVIKCKENAESEVNLRLDSFEIEPTQSLADTIKNNLDLIVKYHDYIVEKNKEGLK